MPITIAYIIGSVVALAGTIVAFIMIVPDKKRAGLNKFFKWLHDFFNFKSLWLEKILKFLYINATLSCIAVGFFMLFSGYESYSYSSYFSSYSSHSEFHSFAGFGALLIFLGPVVVRIVYEFIMLTILMVKNTIDINNKLVPQDGSVADRQEKDRIKKEEEQAARAQLQQQYAQQQYAQQQYGQQQYYDQNRYNQQAPYTPYDAPDNNQQ